MKKHLVWIASASILAALFAVPVRAQSDRLPQCHDGFSGDLTAENNCSGIASSVGLASPYNQLEALNQHEFPIFARRIRFRNENQSLFLTGQLVNRSSEPIYVSSATFAFSRRVDDLSETYATVEVPILQTIQPGQIGIVDGLVDIGVYETTTARLVSVQVGVP